ncbi:DNA polymerase alpha catalytic subunit, partial [Toxocara canis]
SEIVGMILSISTGRDELVEHIHERLRAVRKELDDGLVDMCKFEIMKQLTRDPSEYADIKAQPHAAVALRLNETGQFHFHRGDIVSYIICEDGTGNSAAQRAYHRSEIASRSELVVDILYYLAQQVHPVVCRLCEPIEETDAIQIAQALGIDSSAYHSHATINKDNDDLSLEFAHNFSRCRPFTFLCPYKDCGTKIEVRKTLQGEGLNVHLWLDACPQCKRSLLSYADYLTNQLCLAQMSAIREYYKSSFTCEDVVCAYRTRMHVLSWSREGAVCPKCHVSIMRREKTAAMLFEQQSFFHTLFDLPNALRNCTSEQQKKLRTRKDSNEVFSIHAGMLEICNGFLARNDFNRVSLAYLFSSMRTG